MSKKGARWLGTIGYILLVAALSVVVMSFFFNVLSVFFGGGYSGD